MKRVAAYVMLAVAGLSGLAMLGVLVVAAIRGSAVASIALSFMAAGAIGHGGIWALNTLRAER